MHDNPFSPSFAILPSAFYGRKSYLDAYGKALDTPGSAYRFFFLTGTRGSGKTSLLHQYELQATNRQWDVLKATNIDALDKLVHYVGLDKSITRSRSLGPSVSAYGVGTVSVGELSSASTTHVPLSMLSAKLEERLSSFKLKKGLAIIIDESQKLDRSDVVRISNAVQDVKLEGLPISLVFGGLPSAYRKIRSYKDCTFVRRMKREKLWAMPRTETMGCLGSLFSAVPELRLTEDQLGRIGAFSGGHPYLMQLIGDNVYTLVEQEFQPTVGMKVQVPDELLDRAELKSLAAYKENVLDDVMAGTHATTREYIRAAFEVRDQHGYVDVSQVNSLFGKNSHEMSSRRASALNTQVLKVASHGRLKFALPHYEYIFNDFEYSEPEVAEDEWDY